MDASRATPALKDLSASPARIMRHPQFSGSRRDLFDISITNRQETGSIELSPPVRTTYTHNLELHELLEKHINLYPPQHQ